MEILLYTKTLILYFGIMMTLVIIGNIVLYIKDIKEEDDNK